MTSSAYEKQIIGEIWTTDEPYRNLEHLTDVLGSRWAGSESEHAAGEYLKAKLESYGLTNVQLQPVPFGAWTRGEELLEITSPVQKSFSIIALPYSQTGVFESELVDAGNGEQEGFDKLGESIKGKIAIIAAETNAAGVRGKLLSHRTDKLRYAVDAGAAGLIYINQKRGKEFGLELAAHWRINDAIVPMVLLHWRALTVGYSHDINISPFDVATSGNGGPELTLSYIITKVKPLSKYKVCPIF